MITTTKVKRFDRKSQIEMNIWHFSFKLPNVTAASVGNMIARNGRIGCWMQNH